MEDRRDHALGFKIATVPACQQLVLPQDILFHPNESLLAVMVTMAVNMIVIVIMGRPVAM